LSLLWRQIWANEAHAQQQTVAACPTPEAIRLAAVQKKR
jgi:hypothetical protein